MRSIEEKREKELLKRADSPETGQDDTAQAGAEKSGKGSAVRKRKIRYRVLAVGILIAVFLTMNYIAALCFDRVRNADYFNYDMERLEKQNADVDMIIVGASQVYYGCNPDIISEEIGIGEVIEYSFAAGNQNGMYYMLKEALRKFTPEYVVIDLPWSKFLENDDPSVRMGMYLAADRMSWTGKLDYAIHCFNVKDWINLLCPMYRYGGSVWGLSQLKVNYLKRKAVREGNWVDESRREYRKNGYTYARKHCPQGSIPAQENYYSKDRFSEYNYNCIHKMWELCSEKNIPVIWVSIPTSMEDLYGIVNYQECADDMKSFAESLGCPYLNFYLMKNRDELLPDPMFKDKNHLNGEGAAVFSKVFAEAVKRTLNGEDTSDLFYENLEELKKDVHRIVGCNGAAVPNGDGTITVEVKSFQNEDIVPEYRLVLIEKRKKKAAGDADGNDSVASESGSTEDAGAAEDRTGADVKTDEENYPEVRPWQEEKTFLLEESEIPDGYALRLEVRQKGKSEVEAYQDELESEYKSKMDG